MARAINTQLGGAFVAPWEIDELPGEWQDTFIGLTSRMPVMAQSKQKVESALEKWRNKHPQYGRSH